MSLTDDLRNHFSIPAGYKTLRQVAQDTRIDPSLLQLYIEGNTIFKRFGDVSGALAPGITVERVDHVIDPDSGTSIPVYKVSDLSAGGIDTNTRDKAVYQIGGGGGLSNQPVGASFGVIPLNQEGVPHPWFEVNANANPGNGIVTYSGPNDTNFIVFASFSGIATSNTRTTVETSLFVNNSQQTPMDRTSYMRTNQNNTSGGQSCGVGRESLSDGDVVEMRSKLESTNGAANYEINRCSLTFIQT